MNAKLLSILLVAAAAPLFVHAELPNRNFGNVVSPPDGLMVLNGTLYKVQKGFAVPVVGNGIVRGVDGNPVQIPNGAMYTANGQLIRIPAGISGVPPGLNLNGRGRANVPVNNGQNRFQHRGR